MKFYKIIVMSMTILLLFMITNSYADKKHLIFQDFWYPTYQDTRLAYCDCMTNICGVSQAKNFCMRLGFDNVFESIKDSHVGLTKSLSKCQICRGWMCAGFKKITCVKSFKNHHQSSYYNKRRFNKPRLNNYRVSYCLQSPQRCGHLIALKFCRKMGYAMDINYLEESVNATKDIVSGALCFGTKCRGFDYITCKR